MGLPLDLVFLMSALEDDDFKSDFSVDWSMFEVFISLEDELLWMSLGLFVGIESNSGADVDSGISGDAVLSVDLSRSSLSITLKTGEP